MSAANVPLTLGNSYVPVYLCYRLSDAPGGRRTSRSRVGRPVECDIPGVPQTAHARIQHERNLAMQQIKIYSKASKTTWPHSKRT